MMFDMKPHAIALLSNLAISASLLFIPNLAEQLGASNAQIGVIGAVYGFTVFTSAYLFGGASNVHDRRFFIRLGL
jgi:MFS family permease